MGFGNAQGGGTAGTPVDPGSPAGVKIALDSDEEVAGILPISHLPPVIGDYVGQFTAKPTTTDIPNGKWGIWHDDANSRTWVVINRNATLHGVDLFAPLP